MLELFLEPENFTARGDLYIDDGQTFNYQKKNQYNLFEFIYENDMLTINVKNRGFTG